MSHGNLLTQKARYRSRCTGIGHQQSLHHLQASPRQDPVPAPGRDQARLEAAVFERLGGTIDYCAHPAGVARLHPDTGHLTVELDPQLGPDHSLPEHALQALLPTRYTGPDQDGEGEPGGISGMRVLNIDEHGLHLQLASTEARVTLAGPSAKTWRNLLAAHWTGYRSGLLVPLWDTSELTPFEADYLAKDHTWWDECDEFAWVASGLLRRIAVFHTVTTPYCVRYWRHGLGWQFELLYQHGVPVNHDELIAHLIHERWGMGLKASRDHCACKPCDCDGGAERNCWYTLDAGEGDLGAIGIHFRRNAVGRDLTRAYGRLVAAGADPDWLARALPAHHRLPVAQHTDRSPTT
ncbi:hypothetical protein [Streptomyces sp. b84]|uniref:hypothetical protein n=1 Tax=Streptomyces sp. b84 TaxID=1827631 RepID=UPI000BF15E56|nr:hypothetical protein [Streptomyces sp. b84]